MSDTEQLFILAGVWTAGALFLAYFIPNWWAKAAVVALLVGIPFWELPYGYYNFQKLCQDKLLTFEQIPPQDSLCVGDLYPDMYAMLVEAGFSRIDLTGRTTVNLNAPLAVRIVRTSRGEISSRYCLLSMNNIPLRWRILRHDYLVSRAGEKKIAARLSRFSWAGMWWQDAASPILGHGGYCSAPLASLFLVLRKGNG